MNQQELDEAVRLHARWLAGAQGGKRANLSGADLNGADLNGASLQGVYLDGAALHLADLCGANLTGADLKRAYLNGAKLRGANLIGANLCGANLIGADLRQCIGNGREIKTIQAEPWDIIYTADQIAIERQQHAISDWWAFTDEQIKAMDDGGALEFWRKWKPILQAIMGVMR